MARFKIQKNITKEDKEGKLLKNIHKFLRLQKVCQSTSLNFSYPPLLYRYSIILSAMVEGENDIAE